ncbi:MAG: hypothetical protein LBS62_14960 [Clostridiales bacterium]|jgi:hypothetical protein|nr:hypothetical protein [Clostridiales bacterium]
MAEMTAQEAAEWGKTLNFEKVWAIFAEIGQKQAKTDEQLTRLEKTVKRVSNNAGGLNRSMGELAETLIAARLWEKFPGYGLTRAYQRIPLYDKNNQIKTDIDILLVNTDICMAVEVKHELNRMDEVDRHIKRMQLIRQYPPPLITADKQMLGAMAGGLVDPDVKDYAYKSGFFVLELAGESVRLIQPPEGFEPKKW